MNSFDKLTVGSLFGSTMVGLIESIFWIVVVLLLGLTCLKKCSEVKNEKVNPHISTSKFLEKQLEYYIAFFMKVPRIFISIFIFGIIFCFDYETRRIVVPHLYEKMSLSTFLVGALAIIDIYELFFSAIKSLLDKLVQLMKSNG